jgi:hypothetical protein
MVMQIIHIGKNEPRIETEGARLHPEHARQRQMRMTVIACCEFLVTDGYPSPGWSPRATNSVTGCRLRIPVEPLE